MYNISSYRVQMYPLSSNIQCTSSYESWEIGLFFSYIFDLAASVWFIFKAPKVTKLFFLILFYTISKEWYPSLVLYIFYYWMLQGLLRLLIISISFLGEPQVYSKNLGMWHRSWLWTGRRFWRRLTMCVSYMSTIWIHVW